MKYTKETHQKYTKGPPVSSSGVSPAVDHLRRHVFHCTTEAVCLLVLQGLFTQPEVSQRNVSISIQEYAEGCNRIGYFLSA